MFQSQIDKYSREVRESIVASLNQLGIFHSVEDYVLTVSDEDAELVKRIILKLSGEVDSSLTHVGFPPPKAIIRYDISELDPLVVTALLHDLNVDDIEFTLDEKVLSVPKSQEFQVDAHIARNEAAVNEINSIQQNARLEKSGHQSPACEICGERPAASIDLRRQVGMVVVMRQYSATAVLCESCAKKAYTEFQKSTALKGWTGVKSALMNPVVIGANAVNKKRHKDRIRKFNGGN